MSKQTILSLISRMERIADTLPDRSERELNSLCGQVVGTLYAIGEEFSKYGISVKNEYITKYAGSIRGTNDANDVVFMIHSAAAFLRGKVDLIG